MKKILKFVSLVIVGVVMASVVYAQTYVPVAGVTGTGEIKFNSVTQADENGKPPKGIRNDYFLNVDIDLESFKGTISHLPGIYNAIGYEDQSPLIEYNLAMFYRNPAKTDQQVSLGKIAGIVPITKKGEYRFNDGTLTLEISAKNKAAGTKGKFEGIAIGKPPKGALRVEDALKSIKQITKQIGGKSVTKILGKYDRLVFNNLVIPAGPMSSLFPEATVNGEMLYEEKNEVWYFNDLTMSYVTNGIPVKDKISGNVRWVPDPQRDVNGKSYYEFDIRVNEVVKSEEATVFAGGDDESAFFTVDPSQKSLIGKVEYKDELRNGATVSSSIKFDLRGENLTKQQRLKIFMFFWIIGGIPVNAD